MKFKREKYMKPWLQKTTEESAVCSRNVAFMHDSLSVYTAAAHPSPLSREKREDFTPALPEGDGVSGSAQTSSTTTAYVITSWDKRIVIP
jgi:hypothetical protein